MKNKKKENFEFSKSVWTRHDIHCDLCTLKKKSIYLLIYNIFIFYFVYVYYYIHIYTLFGL